MTATPLTPAQQTEHSRQVVGVLTLMDARFEQGLWCRGARFRNGCTFLIGAIDATTQWTLPGVADEVARDLVAHLPSSPLRTLGIARPRLALALYNDVVGGQEGVRTLVAAALKARTVPGRVFTAGRVPVPA